LSLAVILSMACILQHLYPSHGLTMNATRSEKSMAAGCADRNRPHIGSHETGDESHRKQSCDDRKGGQDRWIADLIDCAHCGLCRSTVQLEMAMYIFNDYYCIIYKDTYRKDECEEGDPVLGYTHTDN